MAVIEMFDLFSATSGLSANKRKCEIFFAGVNEERRAAIARQAHLREGSLPFRYLGIPLNAKRLSIQQFQPLIEKMVAKVRHWSSRLLSYGGRVQLIRSVLYSVQSYWSQIFLFPKKVMTLIESICRKFLWTGEIGDSNKALVAWEAICRPRVEGGLDLIHLPTWNKVCMLKLLWAIHRKADKLWIQWIHAYYIKSQAVLEMESPLQASFLFKKILKVRGLVLGTNEWELQLQNDKFCMEKVYTIVRPHIQKVGWREMLLNSMATPKAKFILWLVLKKRIATELRLLHFKNQVDPMCVLCGVEEETVGHLFYDCAFSSLLLEAFLGWSGMESRGCSSMDKLCGTVQGKYGKARFMKVVIAELTYAIWAERNRRIFQDKWKPGHVILHEVSQIVLVRCQFYMKMQIFCKKLVGRPVVFSV